MFLVVVGNTFSKFFYLSSLVYFILLLCLIVCIYIWTRIRFYLIECQFYRARVEPIIGLWNQCCILNSKLMMHH